MHTFTLKNLLGLTLLLCMSGCAYVEPFVQDLNFISIPEEIALSPEVQQQIALQTPLSNDSAMNQKVNAIGSRLVAALPRRDFDYQFFVVNQKSPNAFTAPGGNIYVHSGLFALASSDAELAGVLAHELGHAFERHPAKNMSRALGFQYLSQLMLKQNPNQMKELAAALVGSGVLTRYGRGDEFEADELGFYILTRAGYSPNGLIQFLTKIQQLEHGGGKLAFLESHPATADRIARLEALKQLPA